MSRITDERLAEIESVSGRMHPMEILNTYNELLQALKTEREYWAAAVDLREQWHDKWDEATQKHTALLERLESVISIFDVDPDSHEGLIKQKLQAAIKEARGE